MNFLALYGNRPAQIGQMTQTVKDGRSKLDLHITLSQETANAHHSASDAVHVAERFRGCTHHGCANDPVQVAPQGLTMN
jgi:hypothetical protein